MVALLGTPIALPEPHRNRDEDVVCRDYEGNILSFCGMPHCVTKREWIRAQKELATLREWKNDMEAKIAKAKYQKKISARKIREDKALANRENSSGKVGGKPNPA